VGIAWSIGSGLRHARRCSGRASNGCKGGGGGLRPRSSLSLDADGGAPRRAGTRECCISWRHLLRIARPGRVRRAATRRGRRWSAERRWHGRQRMGFRDLVEDEPVCIEPGRCWR